MDWQTILLWAARLACPLAIGLIAWWLLRQPKETPTQTPTQQLSALHKHQAALEAEIKALEVRTSEDESADNAHHVETEHSAV